MLCAKNAHVFLVGDDLEKGRRWEWLGVAGSAGRCTAPRSLLHLPRSRPCCAPTSVNRRALREVQEAVPKARVDFFECDISSLRSALPLPAGPPPAVGGGSASLVGATSTSCCTSLHGQHPPDTQGWNPAPSLPSRPPHAGRCAPSQRPSRRWARPCMCWPSTPAPSSGNTASKRLGLVEGGLGSRLCGHCAMRLAEQSKDAPK